jgi:hypothetical protein
VRRSWVKTGGKPFRKIEAIFSYETSLGLPLTTRCCITEDVIRAKLLLSFEAKFSLMELIRTAAVLLFVKGRITLLAELLLYCGSNQVKPMYKGCVVLFLSVE